MEVTVENRGGRAVYLERCYPDSPEPSYTIEHLDAIDTWGSAYSPVWDCVGHETHIRLNPGESRTFAYRLAGPNGFSASTGEARGLLEGEMRFHFGVRDCESDTTCRLGQEIGASNEFLVEVPDTQ